MQPCNVGQAILSPAAYEPRPKGAVIKNVFLRAATKGSGYKNMFSYEPRLFGSGFWSQPTLRRAKTRLTNRARQCGDRVIPTKEHSSHEHCHQTR
jgi:hypothetical protein